MMYGTEGQRAAIDSAAAQELRELLGVSVPCPVGDLVDHPHHLISGSGVVVPWSVFGDRRTSVEVCVDCVQGITVTVEDWEGVPT